MKFFYRVPITNEQMKENKRNNIPVELPVAFNQHVEGSYFGDTDVILDGGRSTRDSTSIVKIDCLLLLITKIKLDDLLDKFPHYKR